MESRKIINGNCWIAHFDILGFSNMVEIFPVEFVQEKCKEAKEKGEKYNVNCKYKFFSDTFIFYTENDSQDSFCGISAASELFFQAMFLKEIPMRGCLNVGQLYADEENGIFFGRALIDAYKSSEGQNWIGFVLCDKTRKKLEGFESADFKSNKNFHYLEYKVPYKKKPKRRKLFVYYPNTCLIETFPGPANDQKTRLLSALDAMEYQAQLIYINKNFDMEKDPDYKKVISKYKNTREFFTNAHHLLRERFESKYPIPNKTNDDEI